MNVKSRYHNQYEIHDGTYVWFQSYGDMVARIDSRGAITLFGDKWNASRTTLRHTLTFLRNNGEVDYSDASDIKHAIDAGEVSVETYIMDGEEVNPDEFQNRLVCAVYNENGGEGIERALNMATDTLENGVRVTYSGSIFEIIYNG